MMNQEHKGKQTASHSFTGTGLLMLFTVMLVLVLSIFSILAYISARADLSLSRINADTVASYYQADTQAVRLLQEFALGNDRELQTELPVTDRQTLSVHVIRNDDSSLEIRSWNVISDSAEGITILD